jgi:drug/metabolite transporter (DMT)-like permease
MSNVRDGRLTAQIVLAFGLVYVIWGSTYLAIRVVIETIPPAASAGARFTLAGLVMLVGMRLSGKRLAAPPRELGSLALVGFLLLVCGNGLVVWSEQYVASGLAALMVATVPLWVSILGVLLPRGQRLSRAGWAGIVLGIVGLCVLLWPTLTAGLSAELRGEGALLMASLCWASGAVYAQRMTVTVSPLVATGWEMLFAGPVLLLIAAAAGELTHIAPSRASWLALAYLVLFGSCIAFSAFIWLLHHVAAAKVTTYAYVNPVIAVLLGCILAGEPFTASMGIGAPIILTAVALVTTARVHTGERKVRTAPRRQVARTAA